MKLLPPQTKIPSNVPHVKTARGFWVPDVYAAELAQNPLPIGDYVEAVTKATGLKRFVESLKGGTCGGCQKRKQKLNAAGAAIAEKLRLQ
jgi:hypothetical protein